MAKVVKADLPHQGPRPELHFAFGAAPQLSVRHLLGVATSLSTTDMAIPGDDPSATKRGAKQLLER